MEYHIPWVVLFLGAVGAASGAKIIMASIPFGSHILEQLALGEELVSRGHRVYIAIGSPYPKLVDIAKRGIVAIRYRIPDGVLYGVSSDLEKAMIPLMFSKDKNIMVISGNLASTLAYRDCGYMMTDEQFLEEVVGISFDLAIIGSSILAPCNLILPKFLGIPYVSMAAFFIPWKHGIPALPSFVPFFQTWISQSDVTLISRFQNLLSYVTNDVLISKMAPQNTTLLEKFAPEFKDWYELISLSQLFLTTTDHYLGAFIPQLPNYISVAGLSTSKAKNLPEDLEKQIFNSEDGIILLSFGTNAYYFPTDVIIKFLNAFGKLRQTVLVKFNIPENATVPNNVKALSWLPQNDILGHPKTKLFITHCGNNGMHEALYHGIPVIGFPLFAEQHRNCQRAYQKGFGLKMDIQDFTSEELIKNIDEVLNNPKYKETIQKASDVFRDQPMHPRERGVFWIEHVIRHGGGHLRSLSMDIPAYQFLMLDILAIIIFAVFVAICFFRMIMVYVYRKLFLSSKTACFKMKSS